MLPNLALVPIVNGAWMFSLIVRSQTKIANQNIPKVVFRF